MTSEDETDFLYDDGICRASREARYGTDIDVLANDFPYPHPFSDTSGSPEDVTELDLPRALLELKMIALSHEIREKMRWWEKMKNETVALKWRTEAKESQIGEAVSSRLTEKMINYVFQELKGYAAIRDPETDIQLACFERIWRSDALVSPKLREDLLAAVALLEATQEPKDWHPGSNGQVLDLVHPSLYPIVYNRTLAWSEVKDASSNTNTIPRKIISPLRPPQEGGTHLSQEFCWLPSDFRVAHDGRVSLLSPYINNMNPHNPAMAQLYPVISSLIEAAIPLWERVLSDLRAPLSPYRFKHDYTLIQTQNRANIRGIPDPSRPGRSRIFSGIPCVWPGGFAPYGPQSDDEDYDLFDEDYDGWCESKMAKDELVWPEALDGYTGGLERAVKKRVSLHGRTLQVIVKLANIVLTPEKPMYPGGTWHVEGMENEHIVSTFIYYYDTHNIAPPILSFRTGVCQPIYHGQRDEFCSRSIYGLTSDDALVQPRGEVTTSQHRCIAFPNIYQHRVGAFSLQEPTQPGHRKIVALFLVDPTISIPSATNVPPQQAEWYEDIVVSKCPLLVEKMPVELRTKVMRELLLSGAKMKREEAEEVRVRFMRERSADVGRYDADESMFGLKFNMCEH